MGVKVLVIDDEEDYRLIIKDVLGSGGFEVETAEDGDAGLRQLERFHADVVLVDWMMPRMDGEEFCKRMRANPQWRDLPVLMLTVKRTADDEAEALHFGADDFLVKPFQPQELLARISAAVRRSKPAGPRGA